MREIASLLFAEAEELHKKGDFAAATKYYREAREVLMTIKKEHRERIDIHNLALYARREADVYAQSDTVEEIEESAKLYEEAGNFLETISNPTPEDLENQANDFYCCAILYSNIEDIKEMSMALFLKAKDIFDKVKHTPIIPETNDYRVHNLSSIGKIYFEEKNWIKAAEFYQKTIELRSNSSKLDFAQARNHAENLEMVKKCQEKLSKADSSYSTSKQEEPVKEESKKESSETKAEVITQEPRPQGTPSTANKKRKAEGEPDAEPDAELGDNSSNSKRLKTSYRSHSSYAFMPTHKSGNSSSTDMVTSEDTFTLKMGS